MTNSNSMWSLKGAVGNNEAGRVLLKHAIGCIVGNVGCKSVYLFLISC